MMPDRKGCCLVTSFGEVDVAHGDEESYGHLILTCSDPGVVAFATSPTGNGYSFCLVERRGG